MLDRQYIVQSMLNQDYKNQQNRLKQVKNKLFIECQQLDERITKQLQKIKQTSGLITQGTQIQTKVYNQSLNSQNYSTQVVDLSTLSQYLRTQKAYLSDLISGQQQKVTKSGKELLHKLSNRKRMQKYLQHLQCVKIQKEIEYLQKNVLIGQATSDNQNIIYEDIQSVTIKQENEQIQKLNISIQQLQRIVDLSNQCGGNINGGLSSRTMQLNKQAERLSMIEQILDRQTKQIVQVKDFFKDYDPKQIIDFLNKKLTDLENNRIIKQVKVQRSLEPLMEKDEIDFILNFQCQSQTLTIFKKPFEELNDMVKSCKAKLKKIKS